VKISLEWIADYATLPAGLTPRDIAHQLTMTTVEVEGVHETPGDIVFEIDNKSLTNRPDLWGHYGVARELAAIFDVPLKPLPQDEPSLPGAALIGDIDATVCRRFTAARIERITVRETPEWVKQRLTAIGQRPKNLYADLTNYVMMTTGQPTHAFDADRLSLPLRVRRADPGERFQALDGTTLELSPADAVVADANGAVGLAGIIGGFDSAIQADTNAVVFEAASFDPIAIRRTSASRGMRTEASTRFEKSLSTYRIDDARRLFFHLLRTIDPSATVTGFDDRVNATTTPATIHAKAAYLCGRIGKDLSPAELREPLVRLGFDVTIDGGTLIVHVPEWRSTGDITGPHDLVEEIARLYGYERFEFEAPIVHLERTARNYPRTTERRVKEYLAFGCGLQEVVTYPWTEDRYVEAAGVSRQDAHRLEAPPAPDQSTLRTSLVPGLLAAIESNIRYGNRFDLFEVGAVFPPGERAPIDDPSEALPPQRKRVAAAFVGPDAEELFRTAKGAIESLAHRVHVAPLRIEPHSAASTGTAMSDEAPWADPGALTAIVQTRDRTFLAETQRSRDAGADSTSGRDEAIIGHLGVLNRRGTRAAGLKHAFAAVFEFDLDGLISSPSRDNSYRPLPELPSVDIDVSLTYADRVTWGDIAATAKGVSPLVAAIEFIDQYRGTGIPAGHRSITLRARLQPSAQTLTSEQATAVANAIRAAAREKLGAIER
jgi:phenylalanyl-tRNA synthetase beta chain